MNLRSILPLFVALSLAAQGTGIAGKVSTSDGRNAISAIVFITSEVPADATAPKREPPKYIVQRGRLQTPVLVVQVGETFTIQNRDDDLYNVHVDFRKSLSLNRALLPRGETKVKTEKPELFARISEDLHRLNGYVCVLETPFYALTDAHGKFTLSDLPPGIYTIEAAHPREGNVKRRVVISGTNTTVDFTFPLRTPPGVP
jgi:hypothetical protein